MRILGIDPSLTSTGYGIIETGETLRGLAYGHIPTKSSEPLPDRLERLYLQLTAVIDTWSPDVCAVETIFTAHNPRTALLLGHARGVVLLTARRAKVPLFEYTPMQIKRAVCGRGRSTKEQVRFMVERLLGIAGPITPLDASDALAAAICHQQQPPPPQPS